jgi:CHAT domain-containing protein
MMLNMTIKKYITQILNSRLMLNFMFVFVINVTLFGKALQSSDTANASGYFRKADLLLSTRMFDSSRFYFEKSLKQYLNTKSWERSIACYNKIAEAYFGISDYDHAILSTGKALSISSNKLPKRSIYEADSYIIMGRAHSFKSNLDSSMNCFQKAFEISVALLGPNHRYVAKIYARMGGVLIRKTENGSAIEYFERALQIFLKSNIKNDPDVAEQYNGIGRSYGFLLDNEEALRYLNLALDMYRSGLGENNEKVADCYNNIGLTHSYMRNYSNALDCFNRSLSIYETLYHGQHPFMLMFYRNIGDVYHAQGRHNRALESYLKAASIGEKLLNKVHPAVASCYGDVLALYITMGDYQKALEYVQKSFNANGIQNQSKDLQKNSSLKGFMDLELLTRTMQNKGLILHAIYTETKNIETLHYALDTYRLCDSLLSVVRKSYRSRADKINFGNRFESLFQNALSGYWDLYKITHNRKYMDSAFYYAERSRAAILSDALAEVNARTMGDIPKELIEIEKNLREEQGKYNSIVQITKNKGNEGSDAIDKLFRINRRYDSLLRVFEKRYPKFYQIKYNDKLASAEDIQNSLDSETGWIQYFINGNIAFAFTFTNENFSCTKLENVDSLGMLVKNFRTVLNPLNNKAESLEQFRKYIRIGRELYQKVMDRPLATLSGKKKLIIIPDGELGYIPFDVLLTTAEDTSRVDYKGLSYLLNTYSIRYGYSATMLMNNRPNTSSTNKKFIAFAPVYNNAVEIPSKIADSQVRSKLTELSWNQQEVNDIAQYMGGTTFVGDQALERTFKSEADQYGVIHLAMHALVDDRKPMFSKLVFTVSSDSLEDGFLNAYELYSMNIPAQMVVLSACETGYGKLEKGEGIMSLGHAFTYAGCPSVVMSHWMADDKATAQLMELFYQRINQGMAKDEALQKAKLDFIEGADDIRQNPAFWAGFVVLGDAQPIVMKSFIEQYWIQIVVSSFVTLVLLIFLIKRGTRRQHD